MNTIAKIKESFSKNRLENAEKFADDLFQIQEYNGKIWLRCSQTLVCPVDLFKGEPIEVLKEIRKLYVERICQKDV